LFCLQIILTKQQKSNECYRLILEIQWLILVFFAFKQKKLQYKLSLCGAKKKGEMAYSISYSNTTSHPLKKP